MDWSTSYQGGSSSPGSESSTEDEDTDDDLPPHRGRPESQTRKRHGGNGTLRTRPSPIKRSSSQLGNNSKSDDSGRTSMLHSRATFTRSRSPAVGPSNNSPNRPTSHRTRSPAVFSRSKLSSSSALSFLPATLQISAHFPFVRSGRTVCIDTRKAGESLLLLGSLLYVTPKLYGYPMDTPEPTARIPSLHFYQGAEVYLLILASFIYIISAHISYLKTPSTSSTLSTTPSQSQRPASPRLPEGRDSKRHGSVQNPVVGKSNFGFVWMTVPKNYRDSPDDGITTGLLLAPLISSALLYCSLQHANHDSSPMPHNWLIEQPLKLSNPESPPTALEALILSRRSVVNLSTLCSTILLLHVSASWWWESRYRKGVNPPEGERGSVPRSEARRFYLYVMFTTCATMGMLGIRALSAELGLGIWQYMNYFEVALASQFYQGTLYIAIRLAHRGFTLGELGLVCFGGISIFMELVNITIARIWPITTLYIKTYRLPTPLLVFQLALIAGSFLTGFLLSPLLVLSRHIAQRPVRRLRFPHEKVRHRRALAAGFYVGAVLIIGGLIGMWTRWCLGKRDPWLWVIFWILEGRKQWSRPALLAYWALLCSISVAGWNRQLARSRKYRPKHAASGAGEMLTVPDGAAFSVQSSDQSAPTTPPSSGALGLTFPNLPNLPNLPNGANVSHVATDLLDAADKHVPTLGLNARRKFFHGLAVVMFLPGVAFDPAFAHLSFSAAFALFTFAEYVRYFALYPFGISVHLFMNEFLDHKDSGTAILSHFYLLTGCAGSVWLEGPTQLLQFTGILALGVGDALASIVGKRIGKHRWSPTTSKTLEGSMAFTLSIVACAWVLRLCGLTQTFSTLRYTAVIGISSVLEALSDQNDNLTLPLYMWSMLVVADV